MFLGIPVRTNTLERMDFMNMTEKQVALGEGEKKRLHKAISSRVYQLEQNHEIRKRLFMALHRDIRDRFSVSNYKEIKRSHFFTAIRYIEAWKPGRIF
jgi:hypothetical protein